MTSEMHITMTTRQPSALVAAPMQFQHAEFRRWPRCGLLTLACALLLACPMLVRADEIAGHVRLCLNPGWRFHIGDLPTAPIAAGFDDSKWEVVSVPHSHELFPANVAGFRERGRSVGWYRRRVHVPAEWLEKKVQIEFQGAMQVTSVWLNDQKVGDYAVSGFDSFHFDLTPFLRAGENLLVVRVDNRVNPAIPPDGVEMDFLLGGGLYRDVFLHVTDRLHLTFPWEGREAGVRLTLPELTETAAVVGLDATVRNESATNRHCVLLGEIRDKAGNVVAAVRQEAVVDTGQEFTFQQRTQPISNPHLWSPDNPYLYQVSTRVLEGDRQLDAATTPLGLRWVRFDRERGFFLNGKALKLVGVNRHETWPFIGHAVPNSLHRFDAEQIKAAGFNWVRLSHYPQDPDFLSALDELGLMALAEPPSWMNRGSALWMTNLVKSFRSMIRRDRNHPCIIAWNACINHQTSHPALVRAALEEDPTRERGQDTLATPMNFHPGQISGDGALAVEHTGHTFPAPRGGRAIPVRPPGAGQIDGDTRVNREFEQAQRHWQQVEAAYRKPDNSGLAVWCMYDYNTFHNVNEPGIVWHGVCDLFRLPKYSFWWHQSELSPEPMVSLVRVDARHAAVFSNCEKIELWEGDGTTERAVASAPILLSRTLYHPPRLYSISTNAVRLRALGLNGDVAKASNQWNQASAPCGLDLVSDRLRLVADGSDLTRLVVRVVDAQGTTVENSDFHVTFTISGCGQLIGENPALTRAGQAIILVQAGFAPGTMTVVATTKQLASATITIETRPVPPTVNLPVDLPDQPTLRILGPPGRLRSK